MIPKVKKKKGFMDGYKTYDPTKEGFGHKDQWRNLFDAVMNGDQARTILKSHCKSPLEILGFNSMPTMSELKTKYRQLVLQLQASFGLNPSKVQTKEAVAVIAAYTILKSQLERS